MLTLYNCSAVGPLAALTTALLLVIFHAIHECSDHTCIWRPSQCTLCYSHRIRRIIVPVGLMSGLASSLVAKYAITCASYEFTLLYVVGFMIGVSLCIAWMCMIAFIECVDPRADEEIVRSDTYLAPIYE
jgi:hypothetical protein